MARLKNEGYYLNKYMPNIPPKTVDEWREFLNIRARSSINTRIKDGDFIEVVLSDENKKFLSTVKRTK